MNKRIKDFVDKFIVKDMRERLLFELSGKKRNKALSRFAHNATDILDPKYTFRVNSKEEVRSAVLQSSEAQADKACVISGMYDGIEMSAQDAIDYAFDESGVSIVIFADGNAFVKSELELGISDKFLLKTIH